jgi:hypothetical protein
MAMEYLEITADNLKKAEWSYMLRVSTRTQRGEQSRLQRQSAGAITEKKENIYEPTNSP